MRNLIAQRLVVRNNWHSLVEVCLNSLLDRFRIIVGAAGRLGALEASRLHDLLRHIVEEDLADWRNLALEVFGLVDGTRESIDQVGASFRGRICQAIDQNLNCQLIRHELAFLDDVLDCLSGLTALRELGPE